MILLGALSLETKSAYVCIITREKKLMFCTFFNIRIFIYDIKLPTGKRSIYFIQSAEILTTIIETI